MEDSQLREFFDMCAEENDGCVYAERIVELARQASPPDNEEAIRSFENAFEAFGTKPISYRDFCTALRSIKDSETKADTENLVRRMSINVHGVQSDDDQLKDPTMDDSSTTFNEYDISLTMDDNRESFTSAGQLSYFENSTKINQSAQLPQYNKHQFTDDVVLELEDKVDNLRVQLCGISQDRASQDDMLLRLQHENKDFRNRLFLMEERIQDVEQVATHSRGSSLREDGPQSHVLSTLFDSGSERASSEFLLDRIEKIESEIATAKRGNRDIGEVQDTVNLLRNRLDQVESHQLFQDFEESYVLLKKERDELRKVTETNQIELSCIQQKLRDLQSNPSSSQGQASDVDGSSDKALVDIIEDLRDNLALLTEENTRLKEQNEHLTQKVEEYSKKERLIFEETPWATELDMMSKQELQGKLQEMVADNIRYRHYVEYINSRIMHECPDLLEKNRTDTIQ